MAVTGWFVALVAVGVVPIIATGSAWALVAWLALVLALGGLDVALAASPRLLRIRRELPGPVRLGETTSAELVIVNEGRRTLRGVVRDAWQPSAGAATTRRALVVRPGRAWRATTTLTPFRRGERRAEEVTVRSIGPLRLAGRQAGHAVPGVVRVLPRFSSRRHLPSRLARLRELDGRTSVMIRGQGTEFDSLREYVRGDDVRSIDWRATARRSDLVVRTWRPERDRRVVIVVDSGRTSAARIDDEPRLDTAFESALLRRPRRRRPPSAGPRAGGDGRRAALDDGRDDGPDRAGAGRDRLVDRAGDRAVGHDPALAGGAGHARRLPRLGQEPARRRAAAQPAAPRARRVGHRPRPRRRRRHPHDP
jgi:uncharacterized protein (DUF58 family)